ncbi:MAG: leucyl aminopeptidase [Gammaproteobacteria bacterium]|nr:leucyl aminopeptidase [Gammaproteobacteria bacterium]
MQFSVTPESIAEIPADCLVIPVWKDGGLGKEASALDATVSGALGRIAASGDYLWDIGDTHLLHGPEDCAAGRILLAGAGAPDDFGATEAAKFLAGNARIVLARNMPQVHFGLADLEANGPDAQWLAARLAQAVEVAAYRYRATKASTKREAVLEGVSAPALADGLEQALRRGQAIGRGMNRARELGNLPGNICTPEYLASHARELAEGSGKLSVDVLDEEQMRELKMGSLLSVAAGSIEEARLIVLHYKGAGDDSKPAVLVGKGVTFDTGGISLKPGLAMDEMKFDMCGAASVLGTVAAVAELQLPINLVGMVAAAENMPGGKATKPGDIVTSMSGKTIEILNTDAEGRLVLCDALTYAERFKPACVIDIATLTGAAVAAFGNHANVMLGNDQALMDRLLQCGLNSLDRAWQLPLWDEYQKQLDSNFADMANIGGKLAGTITAACFLSRYTENFSWAHLDIAGSAWHSEGARKGATGRPVPLLMEFLLSLPNKD